MIPKVVVGTMHDHVRVMNITEVGKSLVNRTRIKATRCLELEAEQLQFRRSAAAIAANAREHNIWMRPFPGGGPTSCRIIDHPVGSPNRPKQIAGKPSFQEIDERLFKLNF